MLEGLEVFARKTGLIHEIERAVLTGSSQGDLFDFTVGVHRENMEAARQMMIDALIRHLVNEEMIAEKECIAFEIQEYTKLIPDDSERQKIVAKLVFDVARKRIEERVMRERACDIRRICDDYRF